MEVRVLLLETGKRSLAVREAELSSAEGFHFKVEVNFRTTFSSGRQRSALEDGFQLWEIESSSGRRCIADRDGFRISGLEDEVQL